MRERGAGAALDGKLSTNLSDDIIREIRQTLVQYKVIFFRNQQLDANEQVALARRLVKSPQHIPLCHRYKDIPKSLT
ncbi:MAG: TauD/TfdA family dioxygenase [Chroococcidiopsidaceae cyanobacterium CP_BM_RX_35]|nr:TauD/TfdA family dioxygenase [Chroococcidiopsidaceae cyanobacterium CP_BM_RX_35]